MRRFTLRLYSLATAAACLCAVSAPAWAVQSETFISDSEHFPGWKGTLPGVKGSQVTAGDPNKARVLAQGTMNQVEWSGEVVQLAWSPRLFLYKGFLSDAECDHLINKARPHLEKSEVVDNDTGEAKSDNVRTSSGAFFDLEEDEVIKRIEERIARVTFLPVENGEGLQVLQYQIGQKYSPHHDVFWDKVNADPAHGGQRIATVLMYLSSPEQGGETVFPQARPRSQGPEWSACAREGLSVKSTRGDAVLFYGLMPNGTIDVASEHGSCPTLKGEKWSATKWIHVASTQDGAAAEGDAAGPCQDLEAECEDWAFNSECEKNPRYMRKSCKKSCGVCGKGDAAQAEQSGGNGAEQQSA